MTPQDENVKWVVPDDPINKLHAMHSEMAGISTSLKYINEGQKDQWAKLDAIDDKLDQFITRHNETCPGRFSTGTLIAIVTAVVAFLVSVLKFGRGGTP